MKHDKLQLLFITLLWLTSAQSQVDYRPAAPTLGVQSLSDVNQYSVKDFAVVGDKVYRLEYHGSFKKDILSIINLAGKLERSIKLEKMKKVERLFKSCSNTIYLLSSAHAYPIENTAKEIAIRKPMTREAFDQYIIPCQMKQGQDLYYVDQRYNGLMSIVTKFDQQKEEYQTLRIISNQAQLENYQSDMGFIAQSESMSTVHSNKACDSERLSRLQAEGDFLVTTFYKPEFPNYICQQAGRLVIVNHTEKKMEVYENGQLQTEVELTYVLDETWLKQLLIDQKTEKIYGLFDVKEGMGIKEIDVATGAAHLVSVVDTDGQNGGGIQIYDDQVYYLQRESATGHALELLKQSL